MADGIEPLLDSSRVGEILGVHPKAVERMAKRGEIPGFKVGKFWRYRASALTLGLLRAYNPTAKRAA